MNIEKIQNKNAFRSIKLILNYEERIFLCVPFDKLSEFKEPIFGVYVKINDQENLDNNNIKFITAKYIENGSCNNIDKSILDISNYVLVAAEVEMTKEFGDVYLQRFSCSTWTELFEIPVQDPF